MSNPTTAADAIALLERTSLPTVLTEGSDDYRIMRKLEKRLSNVGVDFMPLGGKDMVLEVWSSIPNSRQKNVIAFVDLDSWLYTEIPEEFIADNLFFTVGYSIENDLYLDSNISELLEPAEKIAFDGQLNTICADHARQIANLKAGNQFSIRRHVYNVLQEGDKTSTLTPPELEMKAVLQDNFGQALRGKTLFELLVAQLSRNGRYAKIGRKQLYEFGSAAVGPLFESLEFKIRTHFSTS